MNTKIQSILGTLVAAICLSSQAFASDTVNVRVEFDDPDAFRDIALGAITTDNEEAFVLRIFRETFRLEANRKLPAGFTLDIDVSDVDLAGDQEPGASLNNDVRLFRDIYPPRIEFSYTIIDLQGNIVAQGFERLRNTSYRYDIKPIRQTEIGYHVTQLIRNWVRRDAARISRKSLG